MKESKITIKQIFGDHYQEIWKMNKEKYPKNMREHINSKWVQQSMSPQRGQTLGIKCKNII